MVVDLIGPGKILACAEQSNQFGWSTSHSLDCKGMPYSAAADETKRIVLNVVVPQAGTSPQIQVALMPDPAGTDPIQLGQVGPVELSQ